MSKLFSSAALLCAVMFLGSCGTLPTSTTSTGSSSSSSSTSGLASLLGNALGGLLSNSSSVKQADLVGTWKYQAPDCRFESENLLKQAGGEIAAQEVEAKMSEAFSKVGIVKGSCQMAFDNSGNWSMAMGSKNISGTYTFTESNRQIVLSGALGLVNMTGVVCKNGQNLSVLFDSQKLLTLISLAGSLSNNATVKTVSSILGSYDGMKVGFEMGK